MAQVTLEGVTKVYKGRPNVTAVRDANLRVRDQEFLVLVGPSGCGKSTTLRMVAGLEEITNGTVHIGDRVVNDIPPKDRDIAMVFQNFALYPHMTVYDNMAFGLKLRRYGKTEIDRRVRDAAEILGMTELLDRRPKALSGGQRQRVAVGRAIVRKPAVFLFDEPLSNLDAKMRVHMRQEIARLHKKLEATMMFVTHDQEEAMKLGDTLAVMNEGVIQQVASPMKVYECPVNRFVAGFIGSPPMDFIEGRVYMKGGRYLFTAECGAEGFEFAFDNRRDNELSEYMGGAGMKEATLGIRPEHVYDVADTSYKGSKECRTEGRIAVVQPLGPETYLYIGLGKEGAFKGVVNVVTEAEKAARSVSEPRRDGKNTPKKEFVDRGGLFVARMKERKVQGSGFADYRSGTQVYVTLDMTNAHVFDPDTGNTVFKEAIGRR